MIIAPEKYTVNQGCMSVNLFLEYGRHVARLRRRRRRAYAPTSNTASHDNHEKILHGFPFLSRDDYGAPLGGPSGHRSSAINRQQQKNPRSNRQERLTCERGSRAESKNCENLVFPTADRRFDTKVKCPTGWASFWVKFPTVRSLTRVKCPGIARGGMGGFGIDWYITFYTVCVAKINIHFYDTAKQQSTTLLYVLNLQSDNRL